MNKKDSITIIVAALNEEKNLEASVSIAIAAVEKEFKDYEIIIVDDGSTDSTGEIADRLSVNSRHISCIHHKRPKNLGGVYKSALSKARYEYVILINGNNETPAESLKKTFALRKRADIVIPYTITDFGITPPIKGYRRTLFRRVVSRGFTVLLNTLFSLNLKYYNHHVLHKRVTAASVPIRTDSYAFQAELLVKLIKSGYSHIEVGVEIWEKTRRSRMFKWRNIREVILFLTHMIYEINIKGKRQKDQITARKDASPQ